MRREWRKMRTCRSQDVHGRYELGLARYLFADRMLKNWASICSRAGVVRRRGLCRVICCSGWDSASIKINRIPSSSKYLQEQAGKMLKAGC